MNFPKKIDSHSTYEIMSFIKDGFDVTMIKADYTPKENDVTDIFINGNNAVLSIEFQGDVDNPFAMVLPSDVEYKKVNTLPYSEALSFIIDKGFIFAGYESNQMVLRKGKKEKKLKSKQLKLSGKYMEYWNNDDMEEVL